MSTKENESQESHMDNLLKKFDLMESNAENLTAKDIRANVKEFKDCLLEINRGLREHFSELKEERKILREGLDKLDKYSD